MDSSCVRFWSILGSQNPSQKSRGRQPPSDLDIVRFSCYVAHRSKRLQEPPKRPQDPPKSPQRGSKRPPRAPQEAPRGPQERPRRLQEGLKSAQGGSKKASRAAKLHPRCLAKMPCRELTNGHAESSRAGGGVPPKGKAIRRPERSGGRTACRTVR